MVINIEREKRQLEGIIRWRKNNCHGVLAWAPGVGKTYGAVLAILYIEELRSPTYLISVPSQPILSQWKTMLIQFFDEDVISRITIKTVNELQQNDIVYHTDIFIVDELHEYTSDDRIKLINGNRVVYKAFLGLTASISEFSFKRILNVVPIVDEITEREAKEKGFIAQFHEFNVALSLTEAEKERYDVVTEIINTHLPKFNNNLDTAQKCLVGGNMYRAGKAKFYTAIQWSTTYAMNKGWKEDLNPSFDTHRQIIELWHPQKIIGYARALIKAIRDRKHILENSINKYNTAKTIIKKFNKVKTIVFTEDTKSVDKLYEDLKDTEKVVRFHSNIEPIIEPSRKTGKVIKKGKDTQKKEAIDDFKSSKARIMISSRALDRGLNVPDIRLALTISGSSKTTQYEQRGGRAKRLEEDTQSSLFGESEVLLINLYIKDTQDEIWLKNRQKFVEHFIYNVSSVEEISYTPPPNDAFIVDF